MEKTKKKHQIRSLGLLWLTLTVLAFSWGNPLWADWQVTHHEMSLEFNLEQHSLQGHDLITVEGTGNSLHLLMGKDYAISSIRVGEGTTYAEYLPANAELFDVPDDPRDEDFWASTRAVPIEVPKGQTKFEIELRWSGTAFDTTGLSGFSHEKIGMEVNAYISEEGVYLSPEAVYYPRIPSDLATFHTEVIVPTEYRVITSGETLLDEATEGQRRVVCNEPNPIDGLTVSAGKWIRHSRRVDDVLLETFFFPEDTSLVPVYLNSLEKALGIYTSRIGPYPFAKFAVVENFFETGYGLPGFTLLGRRVVRLPFIPYTSLPHELLHNWWGNSVYVDDTLGNWCEGITVYLSDYMYKEMISDSAARDYRRTILRDYTAYTGQTKATALVDFRERTNPALRTVGYGKCAMIFHALHRQLGEEAFAQALRRFYANNRFKFASWADIEYEFEMASGLELGSFFHQWLYRSDVPELKLGQVKLTGEAGNWQLEVEVLQTSEPPYELEFPLKAFCEGGVEIEQSVRLSTGRIVSTIHTPARPERVALDPDAHVIRQLWPDELPATIATVIGAPKRLFVLPGGDDAEMNSSEKQLFESLITEWGGEIVDGLAWQEVAEPGQAVIVPWRFGELKAAGWSDLGAEVAESSSNASQVQALLSKTEGASSPTVICGKDNEGRLVLLINTTDSEALVSLARRLPHYGKYSYLGFGKGRHVVKGVWEPASSFTLREVTAP